MEKFGISNKVKYRMLHRGTQHPKIDTRRPKTAREWLKMSCLDCIQPLNYLRTDWYATMFVEIQQHCDFRPQSGYLRVQIQSVLGTVANRFKKSPIAFKILNFYDPQNLRNQENIFDFGVEDIFQMFKSTISHNSSDETDTVSV